MKSVVIALTSFVTDARTHAQHFYVLPNGFAMAGTTRLKGLGGISLRKRISPCKIFETWGKTKTKKLSNSVEKDQSMH